MAKYNHNDHLFKLNRSAKSSSVLVNCFYNLHYFILFCFLFLRWPIAITSTLSPSIRSFALQTGIFIFPLCLYTQFIFAAVCGCFFESLQSFKTYNLPNWNVNRASIQSNRIWCWTHMSACNAKFSFKRQILIVKQFWIMPVFMFKIAILHLFLFFSFSSYPLSRFIYIYTYYMYMDVFRIFRICAICISSGDSISVEKWQWFSRCVCSIT